MIENRIMETYETGKTTAVWEHAPFFLKITAVFSAFYVICLYDNPAGITYPVFTAGLLGLYLFFLKKEEQKLKKSSVFYMAAILLLGLSTFLTDNPDIILLNKTGSFLLYAVLFVHNSYEDRDWSCLKSAGSLLEFGLSVFCSLPAILCTGIGMLEEKRKHRRGKESKAVSIAAGIMLGLVLLCLILPLLASADAVFSNLIDQAFYTLFAELVLPERLISAFFRYCWGLIFFFALFSAIAKKTLREEAADLRRLEPVTAVTALSLIGIVYLVFCLIQISYLFLAGMELPSGYTYSGFAREGFFQLLFVGVLNLGIVLLCLELFREHRMLRLLLTFLSGCTYIMLISSACKMYLYVQAYGLTVLRVLVIAALLMILLILGGLICSIYRRKFPLFQYAVMVITVIYVLLSLSRMEIWIAEYNRIFLP